jgi:hypothetical protein
MRLATTYRCGHGCVPRLPAASVVGVGENVVADARALLQTPHSEHRISFSGRPMRRLESGTSGLKTESLVAHPICMMPPVRSVTS